MPFVIVSFLVLVWHYICFLIVTRKNHYFFYKENFEFDDKFFRNRERFYEDVFKIKAWKDKVPQYIGKGEFSKKRIKSFNVEYLKEFISETYRAEIDHILCCLIIPVIFFICNTKIASIVSFLVFISNFPCILIQRYNRFRIRRIILKIGKSKKNVLS